MKYGKGPRRVRCPWAPNVLATPLPLCYKPKDFISTRHHFYILLVLNITVGHVHQPGARIQDFFFGGGGHFREDSGTWVPTHPNSGPAAESMLSILFYKMFFPGGR